MPAFQFESNMPIILLIIVIALVSLYFYLDIKNIHYGDFFIHNEWPTPSEKAIEQHGSGSCEQQRSEQKDEIKEAKCSDTKK